jgi:hypothetical protein
MDARPQLGREGGIYHAVALQPALPPERIRHDIHPEMRFSATLVAGMPLVMMGLVDHLQALWHEGLSQLFFDDVGTAHVVCINRTRTIASIAVHRRGPEHVLHVLSSLRDVTNPSHNGQ